MKKLLYLFLSFTLVLLSACIKQNAQLPSNKGNRVDSTTINLRTINEILTQKEDSILKQFVDKQTESYTKTSSGIWYHKETETQFDSLSKFKTVTFSYVLYTINGQKIKYETIKIEFDKKQIPVGLEEGLKTMKKGEKMRLIVPWYLGYGMKGKDNIPSYTTLVYQITVAN